MALKNFKFGFGDGYQEVALPEEHTCVSLSTANPCSSVLIRAKR